MTQSESTLIGLHSEWIGDSQMRARVRRIDGAYPALVVDVTELTARQTSKRRSQKVARDLARLNGVLSTDCVQLCDIQTDHKVIRLKDGEDTFTHSRLMSWAFGLAV